MTEAELLANGDSAAFGALVRLHQSNVRGFLLRMTRGDAALADDLAQDTFLEAYRKIARFRGEGSFAGWLYRIAYTRYLMQARKRKLESLDDEKECALEAPDAQGASMAKLDLEKAMARLAPAERAALTLCFALELSHEDAAMALNQPLGTLKSHIARGREKLRTLLAAWGTP
ncbi:MAG TPA: sigma-70 family RNA polymerase sigma factor [Rhizomicrobium sp.]|jgi:RNA polymerase sigma-70 factor (ECF subfamily)|nr:sigma-70 family RNA polymerase sigma factor [Rhizomicrobium sp.]